MPHVKLIPYNNEDIKHVFENTGSVKHIDSQFIDAQHKRDGKNIAFYIQNDFLAICIKFKLYISITEKSPNVIISQDCTSFTQDANSQHVLYPSKLTSKFTNAQNLLHIFLIQ